MKEFRRKIGLVIFVLFISIVNINAQSKAEFCQSFEQHMNEGSRYKSTATCDNDIMVVTLPIQVLANTAGVSVDMYRIGMSGADYSMNMGKSFVDSLYPIKEALNSSGIYYIVYRVKDVDGSVKSSKKLYIQRYSI